MPSHLDTDVSPPCGAVTIHLRGHHEPQSFLSFIFFGATIACKPLPRPDKAPSSVEDAEDAQFESTDRPEQTVEDDGGEDATTEEDGEVDIGDIGDTGETGTTEEPDEGFDREPMSAKGLFCSRRRCSCRAHPGAHIRRVVLRLCGGE